MPSPYPGMNPYFEHPEIWPGVHHLLISIIGEFLAPRLRPKYIVAVEVRMYDEISEENSLFVGIPDVTIRSSSNEANPIGSNVAIMEPIFQPTRVKLPMPITVRQGYLEIREVETKKLVTAIELLSPTNKRPGEGRKAYEKKRQDILGTSTHLVEIDSLRFGEPMPILNPLLKSHYKILVSRSESRPQADLYSFNIQNNIPSFPIPLQIGDMEPLIDLKSLLDLMYERFAYDLKIDYSQEPLPPLSETDAAWNDTWLRQQTLR